MKTTILSVLALLSGPMTSVGMFGQAVTNSHTHWVVPQISAYAHEGRASGQAQVLIESVEVEVEIVEQVARTTLLVGLWNPGTRAAEGVLLLPVPKGAAVSDYDFEGAAERPTVDLLAVDEARAVYESIVAQLKDPALLEFVGYGALRSSVFPVPAGGRQRVRLSYEHLLQRDGLRVDYVLPRSESLGVQVPWKVQVEVRSQAAISTVYSPSHPLKVVRQSENRLTAVLASGAAGASARTQEPGAFRMSYLLDNGGMSASLMSYPDGSGGGYFLLLAGVPAKEAQEEALRREVTLVIDRSGSMAGRKLEQAKKAALQVLEGLRGGESFQIIAYSDAVERFAARAVVKDEETMARARKYVGQIRSNGGTNIHAALQEAIAGEAALDSLPLVLFLTDGLATVGEVGEEAIATMVEQKNAAGRRIFAFGVGNDVNAPLLDRLSNETRATSTYVLPGEDVEVAVGQVFRRLKGPLLSNLELETTNVAGDVITTAITDLMPVKLPDLFDGDQLILLGRYAEPGELAFRLRGKSSSGEKAYAFAFDTKKASTKNAFVSRLWASRKIAYLVDQIRRAGAAAGVNVSAGDRTIFEDPRFRELSDEILRLSMRFGILSEFTAFLAAEGTDLAKLDDLQEATVCNLDEGAVKIRSGQEAVNQSRNYNERRSQCTLNFSNQMWSATGQRVETSNVQQIADQCFFLRGKRWIDGRAIGKDLEPERTVEFASPDYEALMKRFIREGRQGVLSLVGEILIQLDGKCILVRNAGC